MQFGQKNMTASHLIYCDAGLSDSCKPALLGRGLHSHVILIST